MGSGTERGVAFIANLVAIAGFAAAILGWIDADALPRYTPPSTGVALFILLVFTAFAGYGTSAILRERFTEQKSFFFLMILFMIGFAFSFAYLRNYLIAGVADADKARFATAAFLIGWLLYWLLNAIIFCYGVWFRGKNIIWAFITAIFRPSYWAGFATMIINLVGLPVLLSMFSAGLPTA